MYWTWRRELHVMMRAPILYVVGGLFLVVQGIAFAGLVGALSDPRRPAPLGALLEGQLAGTLLTWVLALVVLTLLGMRAIADDKRSGAWELLLTARVSERAAVLGKWLAATTLYALLWIPTLAYLALVAVYRADAGGWDAGAIAAGYAGAIAIGAALLAWAIAASAAMSSSLGAGALGFALLLGLFLVGELPGLWPDLAIDRPTIASILDAVSIRQRAVELARGEVSLAALAFIAGIAVTGLSLAVALACAGRRRRREVRARVIATLALAAITAAVTILAVRHPVRVDVSAAGRNTLDPTTRDVLASLPAPARITIIRPTLAGLETIYEELARVAARMDELAPSLSIRWVDPVSAPGGLPAVARAAGLAPNDLATSGAVIVDLGTRRRVIDVFALATLDAGPGGAPTIERLAIEQAISGTLAQLALARPVTVCATTGHGELPITTKPDMEHAGARGEDRADWRLVGERLEAEGIAVEDVSIAAGEVPRHCTILLIAGPSTALSPDEALAIQTYLRSGTGALVLAAPTRTITDLAPPTGLEAVLAADGIGLAPAFAVDPSLRIAEIAAALFVVAGYADHPINAGFSNTRATLWLQPRMLVTESGATPLVRATDASWGETDLRNPAVKDGNDIAGPAVLAALGRSGRVVVLGSAESLMTGVLSGSASALDLWLAQAIRHLAGIRPPPIAARTPDQVRLVLTPTQRSTIIALSVGAIPLAWLVTGGLVLLWRRRRAARVEDEAVARNAKPGRDSRGAETKRRDGGTGGATSKRGASEDDGAKGGDA